MDSSFPAATAAPARGRTVIFWISAVCAAALIAVPAWMLVANPAVLGGHPLLPGLLIAAAVVGVAWAVLLWHRRDRPRPRRLPRAIGAWAGRTAVLGLVAALAWLNPFAYQPGAAAEAGPKSDLIVTETTTTITMTPDGGRAPTKGLVFYPGARVDARAYQDILAPAVGAGVRVVILKEPLGLSLLDVNQARSAMADNPDITTWAVGGHSLGGVAASSFAQDNTDVKGLVLYASYPLDSLRGRSGLQVLSVSGTKDGLSTPAKIDASLELLPADAEFAAVQGGVHAFFGDYGAQPGDGDPGISREVAQEQIAAATVDFLGQL
ncbi:alpha/beta hydrolase [Pseudarthrobacter sp. SL88]|uniref:alpha/beta hydrolase n=1 Tax=unclassified Pseudarthrobacter TaxID=2647000 RepID=UPI00227281F3|nr:alpha/beta hydrolase [Pseudarthrobacter sp. SL88]MCY1676530.1 alpha/beta hydrolase [Pseudarthrobacter sp. SL88]MDQ1053885.1 dienelactone hydrolase [Arthrobacter sp. SORGH_AS_0212]